MQEEITLLKQQIADNKREFEDFKNMMSQQTHNGVDGGLVDFNNLTGLIKVVSTTAEFNQITATGRPVNAASNQIFVYYNSTGPVWKLYIYDYINRVWKNATIA